MPGKTAGYQRTLAAELIEFGGLFLWFLNLAASAANSSLSEVPRRAYSALGYFEPSLLTPLKNQRICNEVLASRKSPSTYWETDHS